MSRSPRATASATPEDSPADFLVVAIGASAGGLEACTKLVEAIPDSSDMAFIVVQHLEPTHKSMMVDLLKSHTGMPVAEAVDGTKVEPDHIYLIPPGKYLAVERGRLKLSPPTVRDGMRMPVDFLLNSLAADGARAAAIILSGTGSDGHIGLQALKAAGGYVIAQDPAEAGYDGMPQGAIDTGEVDAVLKVANMPAALAKFYAGTEAAHPAPAGKEPLKSIIALLRKGTPHDFSQYKQGTVARRIERRMAMLGIRQGETASYLKVLRRDAHELDQLAKDMLINVTSFFRDGKVFDTLARTAVPALVRDHGVSQPLRVWIAGCSSGEEAYSIAILFHEEIARSKRSIKLQIFASDLDEDAVATARDGRYPAAIEGDVSAARLKRFFLNGDDGTYTVTPALRGDVIFTVQNVLADPPFSRLDMITCRNLLIYLDPVAQQKVIALFAFALRDNGILVLGNAETIGKADSLFGTTSKTDRIFARLVRSVANKKSVPVTQPKAASAAARSSPPAPSTPKSKNAALRDELELLKISLAVAQEEHKATSEEASSVNEEFQSTNQELLTSKEELQSLNEELTALNSQLQETLERQRTTSDDLQNILYSTDVATIFLDRDLNIRFFTPATKALFSVIPGDVGRPLADLRSLAVDPHLLADASTVLRIGEAIEREVPGTDRLWCRRVQPYRVHGGGVEGVVITFVDITDRMHVADALEAAKQRAELANRAKSSFLAAASHDLRQPLQTLKLLEGLLEKSVEGPKPKNLVLRFGETLAAMAGMLDRLLDINQIEAGTIHAEVEHFPVMRIFDALRDEFDLLAREKNLDLHVVPCSMSIDSDPRLLEQILRNLLTNALKYTRSGKILVGCRRRADTLMIQIWDTGIGIPTDALETIFEEYRQLPSGLRDRDHGLGLGLSIVQRLGKILGHEVGVASKVGHGSVFSIEVARSTDVVQPTPAVPVAGVAAEATGGATIFVIEDDDRLRETSELVLQDASYLTVTAADGAAMLQLTEGSAERPDLILTDFNLPNGMDGLAVAAALRERFGQAIPVIVLTGDISTASLRAIAAADCGHLSKPVKLKDLLAAIELALVQMPNNAPRTPFDLSNAPVIFVVDDDHGIRAMLRAVLEDEGLSVEDFACAEDFIAEYSLGREACLLVDAYLPGMSGLDLLRVLADAGHRIPSIMITGNSDVAMAVQAMKAGALDFIEKPVGTAGLLECVGRALEQSRDAGVLFSWRRSAADHVALLTSRQHEIMDLVLAGHPSKNIAADLGISQRTVENHRAAIMKKTGSRSLPELARLALSAASVGAGGILSAGTSTGVAAPAE